MSAAPHLLHAQASAADQRAELVSIVRADSVLMGLLVTLRDLGLPDWRLVSGAIYQSVWNALTGRPRGHGIKDYDVCYYDASDLTWEAEGAVIRQVEAVMRRQPDVEGVFTRVRVGGGTVSMMLREERERTSQEFEREVAPLLNQIADARVFFRSQQTGGRALNLTLGSDDPVKLEQHAQRIVQEMATIRSSSNWRPNGSSPRCGGCRKCARRASTASCSGRRSRSSRGWIWPRISE